MTEQYERAQELLKTHQHALKTLAQLLLKQETVSGSVVKEALENSPSPGFPADGAHIEESHAKGSAADLVGCSLASAPQEREY